MASDIVFVPGMCSVGSVVYRDLVKQLEGSFPQAMPHVVDLPSVDAIATKVKLEPDGLMADIRAIQAQVQSLVEKGKRVVVVAHSYGGTPALYACEWYWQKQRPDHPGGVLRVALLSSSLTLPGGTVAGDRQTWKQDNGQANDPNPLMEQYGKELFILPIGFEQAWMNDLLHQTELRSSLRPTPLSTLTTPTPREADLTAWNIAYLATTDLDLAMPEPFQQHLANRARDNGAKVQYETIKSGHFVQVSHADEVAKWISRISSAA